MKLSTKIFLPIILISALLILLVGCFGIPSPGYTPGTGTITGIIAAPCGNTSGEPISENSDSPEFWCSYCLEDWYLQEGVKVILTSGEEEIATVFTNELGEYIFTDVPPGKNYVITAYHPDNNIPLVKDVALELIEGGSFDAKTTDLVSTSLGLVVDYVVYFAGWDPEDISLDEVIAAKPDFDGFPKFGKLIIEVRRVLENCEDVNTDDKLLYALYEAAGEISKLDIGGAPGFTPEPEPEPEYGPGPDYVPTTVYYDLTMAVLPEGGGTTDPGIGTHTYSAGTVVTLTATVALGYNFVNWTGDASGTSPNTSVTMDADKSVTAHFRTEEDLCADNAAPIINYITLTTATVGEEYLGQVNATDDDGTITKYELISGPDGMVIDENSGALSGWTPDCDDICEYSQVAQGQNGLLNECLPIYVEVKVTDNCDESDQETFAITVSSTNEAPDITSLPGDTAEANTLYTYIIVATDTDCWDDITYSLEDGPTGMTLTGDTISWIPDCTQIGNHSVTVRATDDHPESTDQTFTITVSSTGVLASLVINTIAGVGHARTISVDDVTTSPITIDVFSGENSITFTPTLVPPYPCSTIRYGYKASGDDNYGPWYEIANGEESLELSLDQYNSHQHPDPNIIEIDDAQTGYITIEIYRGRQLME